MEKSWNLKLSEYSWKNHGFLKIIWRQLFFWLLVVSSFNYFKMHNWSTSMLLLLHYTFMLSVVKLLLKGEAGVCGLNSHGNLIDDHGKSWKNHGIVFLNFCGNPVNAKVCPSVILFLMKWRLKFVLQSSHSWWSEGQSLSFSHLILDEVKVKVCPSDISFFMKWMSKFVLQTSHFWWNEGQSLSFSHLNLDEVNVKVWASAISF